MEKYTKEPVGESRPDWTSLEVFARERIQEWLQGILEEEVTDFLGRAPSSRRSLVDAEEGYRNGYGKVRKLSMTCGTVELRRPRVRGLSERFVSRILPMFKRRTEEVGQLIPDLYLHGLSLGDFDLALRGLLGDKAPLSPATVQRLKARWQAECSAWQGRSLADLDVAYLWVDGIYIKAGLEKEKAAIFVAIAGLGDGTKVVVGLSSGYRESVLDWTQFLRHLKGHGLCYPRLVVGDGHLGIWGAIANVYPEASEQRCWNHRIQNVLTKIPKKKQAEAKTRLTQIPYAPTRAQAEDLKRAFQKWCRDSGCSAAGELLEHDWERMVTFYSFPKEHWQHLRTSNVVESPFSAVRIRTDAAKRYKKAENATAVVWKTLMVVEKRFRKLNAPELATDVVNGARYVDGVRIPTTEQEAAA